MRAYHKKILLFKPNVSKFNICLDYVKTTNSNIELFLKNKSKKMEINVENFENDFKLFWDFIDAEGNYSLAIKSLHKRYNSSKKFRFDYFKNNFLRKNKYQ